LRLLDSLALLLGFYPERFIERGSLKHHSILDDRSDATDVANVDTGIAVRQPLPGGVCPDETVATRVKASSTIICIIGTYLGNEREIETGVLEPYFTASEVGN
jgi:hypothetical protein